jgi:hypothetical protein
VRAYAATESEIAFDIACWFDGDAATEDDEESPPPNDYYIRNDDNMLATGTVTPTATVSWLPGIGDPGSRPEQLGVWLTVRNEKVVDIVEQFVP